MTATSTNPFISTNPAKAAAIEADITTVTAELHRYEAALKTAGGKAERKQASQNVTATKNTLTDLRAALPPTYVDPALAKQTVIEQVASNDNFERIRASFLEEFSTNPAYAIEWKSDDVLKAQTVHVEITRLIQRLSSAELGEMESIIRAFREEMVRNIVSSISDSVSTSPAHNMSALMKQAAWKDLYDGFKLGWAQHLAGDLSAKAEETKALRAGAELAQAQLKAEQEDAEYASEERLRLAERGLQPWEVIRE